MILNDILNKENLTKEELISLLSIENEIQINKLFKKASEVREKYCGNEIHLRGIIEFSNYCEQYCLYCGIRKGSNGIKRFRMSFDEIIETANIINQLGIKTIVLQSGEDSFYTKDFISNLIKELKDKFDVAITLSLGERNFEEYQEWKTAGADRYLLKHETANEILFSFLHNKQKLKDRLDHLIFLKEIGYQIGTGNIVGLPHQTLEDIANDLILCKKYDVDMASFSPFVPSKLTPFYNQPKCNLNLILKTMAVARIYLKNTHIPATTALATLEEDGREKGILAGANVVMPSFTPFPFRDKYLIYDNKRCITEDPIGCLPCLSVRINMLGFEVSKSKGDSFKKENLN